MRKSSGVVMAVLLAVLLSGINAYGAEEAKGEHDGDMHKPTFGMYVKSYFEYSQLDEEGSTFHAKHIRPWVKGKVNNFISYKVKAEFAHEAALLDAYADFRLSSNVSVRVGQWKVPFSTGWLVSANDTHFITRELGKKLQPQRDRGVAMTFTSSNGKASLTGSVFNGATQNLDDANKYKDIVLRGTVNPVESVQLSLGYYYGKTNEVDDPEKLVKFAPGILVNHHHLTLLSEYIIVEEGEDDKTAFVALAGYGFPTHSDVVHEVKPYVRFDNYDPDYHHGKLNRTTIGLNFYFHDHYNKIQLNYEIRNEEGIYDVSNNRFMAAVQINY
jgi:hypothetical protein